MKYSTKNSFKCEIFKKNVDKIFGGWSMKIFWSKHARFSKLQFIRLSDFNFVNRFGFFIM